MTLLLLYDPEDEQSNDRLNYGQSRLNDPASWIETQRATDKAWRQYYASLTMDAFHTKAIQAGYIVRWIPRMGAVEVQSGEPTAEELRQLIDQAYQQVIGEHRGQ